MIKLDLWDYVINLHNLVDKLQKHLKESQDNLSEVRDVLIPFARQPLLERKDGKKDTVLCIDDKEERIGRRRIDIKQATEKIELLLQQNQQLFEMTNKQGNIKWINYINYVDKIVMSYLFQSVGCR